MADEGARRPWRPERLTAVLGEGRVQELRYVVLEELVDHIAVLQAWPWPVVDDEGRLTWPLEQLTAGPLEIATDVLRLRQQCYRASVQRVPRSGDTFAGRVADRAVPREGLVEDLRDVFPDGLYDLSAEAHQAAKLAYQGALAAIGPPQGRAARERSVLRGRAPHLTIVAPVTGGRGQARR